MHERNNRKVEDTDESLIQQIVEKILQSQATISECMLKIRDAIEIRGLRIWKKMH